MPEMNVPAVLPLPKGLAGHNPLRWLRFFGPGAIIASLTIATGELIFSTRGGAIFGYRILWLFLFISVLKWGLVYGTSRHMALSGAHPFERWMHLPGPAGWFPILMLLQEAMRAVDPDGLGRGRRRLRTTAICWCGFVGFAVLAWNARRGETDLVAFITPTALFTGVLSCGFVCLLAPWADRRFLPAPLRMNRPIAWLNLGAGVIFVGLGIKSYWDYGAQHGTKAAAAVIGVLALAVVVAFALAVRLRRRRAGSGMASQ